MQSSVLERGECLIGLEGLRDMLGGLRLELVTPETANANRIQVLLAADTFQAEFELLSHFSEVRAVAVGIRLLRTIDPGIPMPFPRRSSSVTLFSRRETSGVPQKSVSDGDSSTILARFSAPSPVMPLEPTLQNVGGVNRCHWLLTVKGEHTLAGYRRVWGDSGGTEQRT